MNRRLPFFLVYTFFVGALLPMSLRAGTYYVASTGLDTNDGMALKTPFKTIRKAVLIVQPGDTVNIREGVYNEYVLMGNSRAATGVAAGKETRPIVWQSYKGEWAIIDGSHRSVKQKKGATNLLNLRNAQWNIFRNLEVRNSQRHGIALFHSNNNVFENIVTHGHHGSGQTGTDSSSNRFVNCTSYDNYDSQSVGYEGGGADGFCISSGQGNTWINCLAYDNSDDGWDCWKSTSNTIMNCVAYGSGRDKGDGNGFKLGGAGDHSGGHLIRNCVAYNNRFIGFDYNNAKIPIKAYNNTAWNNKRTNYRFKAAPHVLRNNISQAGTLVLTKEVDHKHNSWNLNIDDALFISTNPASATFLKLSARSPAKDRGINVGLPYQGSAPDLGAYEHGTTASSIGAIVPKDNGAWSAISTNTLSGGSALFTDPQATNHPNRYYRITTP